ncbi:MAG TPA: hypothetical protein ENF34_04355 [Candidatus Bathyarchaeota archaeon]|nr:hypothetical protein [Candidatus Bathyarchaeota archaeon]
MPGKRRDLKRAREQLEHIIEMCEGVEAGGLDPFSVPVEELIEAIRALFHLWEEPEDLSLDARAVEGISSVIKAQSEWVRERSTRLYMDPFLVEERLSALEPETLASLFLRAWHPVVELEQMTPLSLEMALKYWSELPARGGEEAGPEELGGELMPIEGATVEEERVEEEVEALWEELKRMARGGSVPYWEFIMADTYSETVRRAYLTSFMVSYDYAKLEVDPLRQELVLRPRRKPRKRLKEKATSVVIPISYEEWASHAS